MKFKYIFTFLNLLLMIIITGCGENNSSILEDNSVNLFLASDIPNNVGTWWIYEYKMNDLFTGKNVELKREILQPISNDYPYKETYLEQDSLVLATDTSYFRLTNEAFSLNVDGQWKDLLRFPAKNGLNWLTYDGDELIVESTTETVSLPIGNFYNCIKVTSTIDNISFYYAYGLGLLLIENIDNPVEEYIRLKSSSEFL